MPFMIFIVRSFTERGKEPSSDFLQQIEDVWFTVLGSSEVMRENPCRARHWSEGVTPICPLKPHGSPREIGSVPALILLTSKEMRRSNQITGYRCGEITCVFRPMA